MDPLPTSLIDLFPNSDYRHRMHLQPGSVAGFFGATPQGEVLLGERGRWLNADAPAYAEVLPEGEALVEDAWALLHWAGVLGTSLSPPSPSSPREKVVGLGRCLEPDFLLLRPDTAGAFQLLAGCVCFPSSWSLAEKMGRPLEFIHDVVPGLNSQLGRSINAFLAKLQPGEAWQRANWGLSRSSELNQHPDRCLPKLDATVELDEVWLRIEHQILARLPASDGVLFGIRLANHPLAELKRDAELSRRFCLALATMSEAMAAYKNVASARARLLALMA